MSTEFVMLSGAFDDFPMYGSDAVSKIAERPAGSGAPAEFREAPATADAVLEWLEQQGIPVRIRDRPGQPRCYVFTTDAQQEAEFRARWLSTSN